MTSVFHSLYRRHLLKIVFLSLLAVALFGGQFGSAPRAQQQGFATTTVEGRLHNQEPGVGSGPRAVASAGQGQSLAPQEASTITSAGRPLLTPRRDHTATLLSDGRVLVAGGRNGSVALGSAEIYDPSTGAWGQTQTLKQARYLHAAVLLRNGKVLLTGGTSGSAFLKSAEIYDPAQDTWTLVESLKTDRQRHAATLLANGSVMVAGGENSKGVTRATEVFNGSSWSNAGDLNTGRREHAAALLPNGVVLVAGGRTNLTTLASVEAYDPQLGRWRRVTALNQARRLHSLTLLQTGEVLAAGGHDGSGATVNCETFNTHTQRWTRVGDLRNARHSHAAVLLPNGKAVVVGGAGSAFLATSELYDPVTKQWTLSDTMTDARADFTATLLTSGRLLIAGGTNNGQSSLNGAELFENAAPLWRLTRDAGNAQTQMSAVRYAHTATMLADGRVLVIGGLGTTTALASAEVYDPFTRIWSPAGTINPDARAAHTATLLADGRVLVVGGFNIVNNQQAYLRSAEIYDPTIRTWTKLGNVLGIGRAYHTTTLLRDGRVLVAGGRNETTVHLSGDIYNTNNTWTPLSQVMAQQRREHSATLLPSGRVLFAGGQVLDGQVLSSAETYDPVTRQIAATRVPMPARRRLHNAVLMPDNRVLVIGGTDGSPSFPTPVANVDIYDPATNDWTATGALTDARYFFSATLLTSGKVLVAGGIGNTFSNRAELYDPATGRWALTSNLSNGARTYHTGTLLLDGQVLLAGGVPDDVAILRSSETYDPGLGFAETVRPSITNGDWFSGFASTQLDVTGLRFQGVSEAAGGGSSSSTTNHPVLQVRSLANDQVSFVPVDTALGPGWSNTTFTARPGPNLPAGFVLLTIFANGMPSRSHTLRFGDFDSGFATVRGRIADRYGAPLPAISLTLTARSSISGTSGVPFATQTALTDANGTYSFAGLPIAVISSGFETISGRFPVTYQATIPQQQGFTFNPSQSPLFTTTLGQSLPGFAPTGEPQADSANTFTFNSTGAGGVFSMEGRVICPSGNCAGISIVLQSTELPPSDECPDCTQPVGANGSFKFTELTGGAAYTELPAHTANLYVFAPGNLYVALLNSNQFNQSFVASTGNPTPRLSSLAQSSVLVGNPTFSLTVNGSDFADNARLLINGEARETTFISSTQLQAEILESDVAAPRIATIAVSNPAPGGGTSNSLSFNIAPPAVAPSITGAEAINVTTTTATLRGTVNPNGAVTQITFEYDTNPAFTTKRTATAPSLPAVNAAQTTSVNISGLVPKTTYYFHIVAMGALPATGDVAQVTTAPASIAGLVRLSYGAITQPVPGVSLALSGASNQNVASNAAGAFSFGDLSGGNYSLAPSKTGDIRGISNSDASRVAIYVLNGTAGLNQGQLIAADANGNGTVSNFDASLIAGYVLNGSAPGTAIGTWRFLPASLAFNPLADSVSGQNFEAVLVGDATGNWAPSAGFVAERDLRPDEFAPDLMKLLATILPPTLPQWPLPDYTSDSAAAGIAITLPTLTAQPGASVTVPITVESLTGRGVLGYEFDFLFDQNLLTPQAVVLDQEGTLTTTPPTTVLSVVSAGRVRVVAFGATPLTGSGTLLKLKFTVPANATPGATTQLRLNPFTFNEGDPASMTTDGSLTISSPVTMPTATTVPANNITTTTATLNGMVNPNGGATTTFFEWSTNSNLDASPNVINAQPLAAGSVTLPVSANLTSLAPGTTYFFRAAANNSAGTTRGANQSFTTTSCTFTINPTSQNFAAGGGTGSVNVNTAVGCAWTAASNNAWITVNSGASGSGAGAVGYTVAANTGPQRSGTITIAGQTFTVTQDGGCVYSISPASQNFAAGGGTVTVTVTTAAGCAWMASGLPAWITVNIGAQVIGSGTVILTIASNNGPARSATITIAGQSFNVTQDGGCTFSILPTLQDFTAAGGSGSVAVTTATGCAWTTSGAPAWVTITSGASGNGNGTVAFTVAANNGPARNATLTIAGQNFAITQGGGCTFSLGASSQSFTAAGGSGTVALTASNAACAWTATSSAPDWLTLAASGGTGSASVGYVVAPYAGTTARSATLTIAGQSFNVTQTGCTFTINPSSRSFTAAGGADTINVTAAGSACAWMATSNRPWITITGGASGTGNGAVSFSVAANPDPTERTGAIAIADQSFAVTQAAAVVTNRVLRAGQASGSPGSAVSVPIELVSQGDENALGFSLTFDPAVLSNPQATLGADAVGASLNTNNSQTAQGRFGVIISLPTGQRFSAGIRQVVNVSFTLAANASAGSTPIGFGDQPIPREIADASANPLPTNYVAGAVTIAQGYEADVAPRPNGNGSLTVSDWVQAGRFVAGIDTPDPGSEFQRADTAPRATLGDGRLTIADWVQAGRYAAGLEPLMAAGGPTGPAATASGMVLKTKVADEPMSARILRIAQRSFDLNALIVELDAQGNENALGFSLGFDPARMRFVSAALGNDAAGATLNLNTRQMAGGRLGIAIALPAGQSFAAGLRQLLTVTFVAVAVDHPGVAAVNFLAQPVTPEAADANANALSVRYAGGGMRLAQAIANVSAASFLGESLAAESIVAAFGSGLATGVAVADSLPLPTALLGTSVKVRDSAGAERDAPLFFVGPGQVNYQIPPGTAPGAALVTIMAGDGSLAAGQIDVASVAPGLLSANADGQGIATALVLRVKADGAQSYEPLARFDAATNAFVAVPLDLGPATDQVFLIVFGTGIRGRDSLSAVTARLGGAEVPVLYAGAQGSLVGLDQINLGPIPRGLAGRGEMEISLTVEGREANLLKITVH